jgi:aspartate/methionine/tyrosine aminotransferase
MRYVKTCGSDTLRKLIADWYDVDPENVLVTNGTSEANFLVNLSLIEQGDEYFSEIPQYEQASGVVRMLGAKVKPYHLVESNNWCPDIEELKSKIGRQSKMIFLNNPNNPTGAQMTRSELEAICEIADKAGAYVHCDNALRGSEPNGAVAPTPDFYEKGITTGSISKLGATSPRIGWIIADSDLIRRFWVMKDYTTLSHCGIGELLAERLLQNRVRYIKRNMDIRKTNMEIFQKWIAENADLVTLVEPTAGFTAFPKYKNRLGSSKFCERLLKEEKVLLSSGDQFGVEKYLRINIGSKVDTLKVGLERLTRFMRRMMK